MKKIFTVLLLLVGMFLGIAGSNAQDIYDVDDSYWAVTEIRSIVNDRVMLLYEDCLFKPELEIKRAEFNSALLRALNHQPGRTEFKSTFKDMQESHWAYNDVAKSEQLGLIYGYPDNTFRPNIPITKAEAESILSHITQDETVDTAILNNFKDGSAVPNWDKNQYSKMIKYGIYVNHPDEDILLPNKNLNRAETAVLLYKLREKLGLVKSQYVAQVEKDDEPVYEPEPTPVVREEPEVLLATEHLHEHPNPPVNEVLITNKRNIIKKGNILAPTYVYPFNSKNYNQGDILRFDVLNDVKTTEGTLVIPARSILSARVSEIKNPQVFNRSAEVILDFFELKLPSKQAVNFPAKVYENDGVLKPSTAKIVGKVALYTLGGAAVGTGIGVAAGAHHDHYGKGIAIGAPVGAGVGLATGLITPGLAYHADQGEVVYIQLVDDVSIYLTDL